MWASAGSHDLREAVCLVKAAEPAAKPAGAQQPGTEHKLGFQVAE